jgi:hypothetical protein
MPSVIAADASGNGFDRSDLPSCRSGRCQSETAASRRAAVKWTATLPPGADHSMTAFLERNPGSVVNLELRMAVAFCIVGSVPSTIALGSLDAGVRRSGGTAPT